MTEPSATAPQATEPDEAAPLDQDQQVLVDEIMGDSDRSVELTVVKDEKARVYDATVGDQQVGGLTYSDDGDRIVLIAVSVFPQFRNQGAASKLIRHALDDVRAQGKTATILCPIVRTFIDSHAEYQDVVDPDHPGVVKVARR